MYFKYKNMKYEIWLLKRMIKNNGGILTEAELDTEALFMSIDIFIFSFLLIPTIFLGSQTNKYFPFETTATNMKAQTRIFEQQNALNERQSGDCVPLGTGRTACCSAASA